MLSVQSFRLRCDALRCSERITVKTEHGMGHALPPTRCVAQGTLTPRGTGSDQIVNFGKVK